MNYVEILHETKPTKYSIARYLYFQEKMKVVDIVSGTGLKDLFPTNGINWDQENWQKNNSCENNMLKVSIS